MSLENLPEFWIEYLDVFSKWLWPITVIVIVSLFRADISKLLGRIRKGSLFGNEFELDPVIDQLRRDVEQAQKETLVDQSTEPKFEEAKDLDYEIKQVLEIANNSPELALMKLSAQLEKETRILLGSLGALDKRLIGINQMFNVLTSKGYFSKHTTEALRVFSEIRNSIVHGRKPEDDRVILKVLDVGIDLLKTIKSIPHEINIVYDTGLDLYSDEDCNNKRGDVKGLMLETTSSDQTKTFKRIFPTTNYSYYQIGKSVTWEWNLDDRWDHTWYIDKSTGAKKLAWNQSAEFIGRHIEDL